MKIKSFITLFFTLVLSAVRLICSFRISSCKCAFETIFRALKLIFDICSDVLKTLSLTANAKNIAINCLTEDNLNIFADIDMLRIVLRNLVSNAIKFTNNGGAININAEKNTGNVTISVSDNGIGIKPDYLAKLFDISQVLTTTVRQEKQEQD